MSKFSNLRKEIEDGMQGKNSGIPMGFNRLNSHVSIRRAMYYLLGGYTGSGKTSLADDAFVLNPMDYIITQKPSNIDMRIIYFSMERRENFKLAKWISRKIFLDTGKPITVNKIFGWTKKEDRLTLDEHDLIMMYEDYITALEEKIEIIQGPQSPIDIKMYVDNYAKKHGTLDTSVPFKPVYYPNNEKIITLIISDTIGLTKGTKEYPKGKPAIDKSSADKQRFRDLYGYSILDISQFNRDIANPTRIKNGDVEPMLEDFKDTGSTQENADVVLSLFDPMRYKVPCPSGYDLDKLREPDGTKKYRSLKILKNSYGTDDIRIGLALQPHVGLFKEMPSFHKIKNDDYEAIINNSYFLQ
jgi:hypothetical protein